MLPVNELFETIQGEAYWTGTPSVFVRLQGCNVGCPWCDTRHTWQIDESLEVSMSTMLAKKNDGPRYAMVGISTLIASIEQFQARHVVITGGEPCQYDLTTLTGALKDSGRSVQVETSGTEEIRVAPGTWVTVSPKFGMPGGKVVSEQSLKRANEIKMPVGRPADIERLKTALSSLGDEACIDHIWLQPLSQNQKATMLCIEAARENRWRISVQVHKFLGVR